MRRPAASPGLNARASQVANPGARLLSLARSRRLARSNGPHRFVGNDNSRKKGLFQPAQSRGELRLEHVVGPSATAFSQGLPDAEDRIEPAGERRVELPAHDRVVLAEDVATLGVPDEHVMAPARRKHVGRHGAGERALGLEVDVLRAKPDGTATQEPTGPIEARERREDGDLGGRRPNQRNEPSHEGLGFGRRRVHLPVSCHETASHRLLRSEYSPGRCALPRLTSGNALSTILCSPQSHRAGTNGPAAGGSSTATESRETLRRHRHRSRTRRL